MVPEKQSSGSTSDVNTLRAPRAQGSSDDVYAEFRDAVRHGRNQFPLMKNMSDTHLTPTVHRKHHYSSVAPGRNNGVTHPTASTDISSSDSSLNTSVVQEMVLRQRESGLASVFRWFKRNKDQLQQKQEGPPNAALTSPSSAQTSPDMRETRNGRLLGSNSSVNSTLSTASSFAFLHSPRRQKKMAKCPKANSASVVHPSNPPGTQTDLLRKKYGLHVSSETLANRVTRTPSAPDSLQLSAQNNRASVVSRGSFPSRKKRPAPPPPTTTSALVQRQRSMSPRLSAYVEIRNTERHGLARRVNSVASESGAPTGSSGLVHVRGKRRAPSPPVMNRELRSRSCVTPSEQPMTTVVSRFTSLQRKSDKSSSGIFNDLNKNCAGTKSQWYDKMNAIATPSDPSRLNVPQETQDLTLYEPSCPRNDILKLEHGLLTPVTDRVRVEPSSTSQNEQHRLTLPLKPWYKRSTGTPGLKKEVSVSEKPKKKSSKNYEEILVDTPYRRSLFLNTSEKLVPPTSAMNSKDYYSPRPLLRSLENGGDAKKNEVKRRSLLANISELDREAAEIIQRDKERENARKLADDAKFYDQTEIAPQAAAATAELSALLEHSANISSILSGTYVKKAQNTTAMNITVAEDTIDVRLVAEGGQAVEPAILVEKPKKNVEENEVLDEKPASAKELINMFNSFNVTRVKVNPTYVKDEDHSKRMARTETPHPSNPSAAVLAPIPAVVSDLNKFLDSTRQDLSSPKVVRKLEHQGVRPKEKNLSSLPSGSPGPTIPELPEPSPVPVSIPFPKPEPKIVTPVVTPSKIPANSANDMWACKVCTLLNKSVRLWCEACSALRPRDCPPPDFQKLRQQTSSQSASPAITTKLGHEQPNSQVTSPTPLMSNGFRSPIVRSASQTNWEVEIKKYFPSTPQSKVTKVEPPKTTQPESSEGDSQKEINEKQQQAAAKTPVTNNLSSVPMPSTFLGSANPSTSTDIEKRVASPTVTPSTKVDEKPLSTDVKSVPADPEEIRKARLAFFGSNPRPHHVEPVSKRRSKSPENFKGFAQALVQNSLTNGTNLGPVEMKNSLAKHVTKVDILSNDISIHCNQEDGLGASKISEANLHATPRTHDNSKVSGAPVSTKKTELLSNTAAGKPVKVSSSCQTSIEILRKTSPVGKKIAQTTAVEQNSRAGLNLEVMEAGDFAAIEAACNSFTTTPDDKTPNELAALTAARTTTVTTREAANGISGETGHSTPESFTKPSKGADERNEPLAMRVLLQALEDAIAAGQFDQAASLSRQLALLKQQLSTGNAKQIPETLTPASTEVKKLPDVKSPIPVPSEKKSVNNNLISLAASSKPKKSTNLTVVSPEIKTSPNCTAKVNIEAAAGDRKLSDTRSLISATPIGKNSLHNNLIPSVASITPETSTVSGASPEVKLSSNSIAKAPVEASAVIKKDSEKKSPFIVKSANSIPTSVTAPPEPENSVNRTVSPEPKITTTLTTKMPSEASPGIRKDSSPTSPITVPAGEKTILQNSSVLQEASPEPKTLPTLTIKTDPPLPPQQGNNPKELVAPRGPKKEVVTKKIELNRLNEAAKKPEKVTNGSQTQIMMKRSSMVKSPTHDESHHKNVTSKEPQLKSVVTKVENAPVSPLSRQALAPVRDKEAVTPIKVSASQPLLTHSTLTSPELVRKALVNDPPPQAVKQLSLALPVPVPDSSFTVQMFIEDKVTHHGPFPIKVKPQMTLLDLKKLVETEYEVPVNFQRWILHRTLAKDDRALLEASNLSEGSNIFLYLVAPEIKKKEPKQNGTEVANQLLPNQPTETANKRYYNYEEDRYSTCSESEEEKPSHMAAAVDQIPVPQVPVPLTTVELVQSIVPLRTPSPPTINVDGWICGTCTLQNPWDRPGCAACTAARPVGLAENLGAVGLDPVLPMESRTSMAGANDNDETGYKNLLLLDGLDLVPCSEAFQCPVCFMDVPAGIGITLRECLHAFCKDCLSHAVEFCEEAVVSCPFRDESYACPSHLQEREIKALVRPDVFEKFLARSMALAEKSMKNTFHCQTPDCPGWCIIDDNVNLFRCPVCGKPNCLTCQAIHEGLNCKQFQDRVTEDADTNEDAKRTRDMIDALLQSGDALNCPQCQVVLMKRWGCDWVRCSVCRTEICWVTKGPRWGPNGKGDTSAGCRCGVNNVKCHPKCNYCH